MKPTKLLLIGAFLCIIFILPSAKAQQWGLYTLYATKNGTQAYLIDTNSTTYKTWSFSSSYKSGYSTYFRPDTKQLIRTVTATANPFGGGGGVTGIVQIVEWDGTVSWTYQYTSSTYTLHHDICPLPNGNILMISYDERTSAEATQAGSSSASTFYSEKLIEVQPTGATTGTIVWEWKLWDHLCQNYDSLKDNYVTSIINNPQLLNINYTGTGTLPDRYHMNGIDYNEEMDQLVLSMHFMNSAFVIDHSTTTAEAAGHTGGNSGKGGDFLYRWGNPASYGATGSTMFNVIHDAHWVSSDNPYYPNYLVGYNNRGGTSNTTAVTIWSPPYNGNDYTYTTGTAYAPASYSYQYNSVFSASNEGNSQQLPNGNMLVNNSFGSLYEVNGAGTTLWTKASTNSTHAYRFTLCEVRGPVVTATASETLILPGTLVSLDATASSPTETTANYTYEWSANPAGFTASSQSTSDSPLVNTTYTVTVTNSNLGCSTTASVEVSIGSGIHDVHNNEQFTVSPNPTHGQVFLSGSLITRGVYEVYVYDVVGSLLITASNTEVIDLSNLTNGLYFLKISADGYESNLRKILLQR